MTKKDLVVRISKDSPVQQDQIARIVQKTLDYIADELSAGRSVELRNFGVFDVKVCRSRVGRNPRQPENLVVIPERAVVRFRAGKILKNRVENLTR